MVASWKLLDRWPAATSRAEVSTGSVSPPRLSRIEPLLETIWA